MKEIIENWMVEAGLRRFNETIAFHVCKNNLFIITKFPGWFIGVHGNLVEKYREIMKQSGYDLQIHFIDLSCGTIREF